MNEILASMSAVTILADDLHYRSLGRGFYALHLLADRVKEDLDKDMDALRESYYLGQNMTTPPTTCSTYAEAVSIAENHRKSISSDGIDVNLHLILVLKSAVHSLYCLIEQKKRDAAQSDAFASGVVSLLDGISQKMLIAHGLLDRSSLV